MLSKSPIESEPKDSRISAVIVGSCLDCFRTGDMAMTVMIMIVNAIRASIVKNCPFDDVFLGRGEDSFAT